jgi:hypothetical protein
MKTAKFKKGWIPDLPDFRDYDEDTLAIKPLVKQIGLSGKVNKNPPKADLRQWCPRSSIRGTSDHALPMQP